MKFDAYYIKNKIRRWTYGSKECYLRGMICNETCSNYKTCKMFIKIGKIPPMKGTVLFLSTKFTWLIEEALKEKRKKERIILE